MILGQVSSLFGNYIIKSVLSIYVFDTTGTATIFACILSIATMPTIPLSPLGGIFADRANRKNIMVALDTLSGVFASPTVQACVPQMQSGDNIIKGNAVVDQVAAVAALIAPILGSVLYTAFGLKPVLYAGVLCFFVTAAFECLIKLEYIPIDNSKGFFPLSRVIF